MKKLCLLGLVATLASHAVFAETKPAALKDKNAFVSDLMKQMTLDEKIGQLRLISIGPEMPREMIRKEIAAGRIGGTFNSVTRPENRPMQDAAMRSRLKIPMFFAYDVIHGHRTIFPISLALASSWTPSAAPGASPPRKPLPTASTSPSRRWSIFPATHAGAAPPKVLAKTPTWCRASPR